MSELETVALYTRGIATPGGGAYGALLVCNGRDKELCGGEQRHRIPQRRKAGRDYVVSWSF